MAKYTEEITAWATDNYDKSYGHSAIVECWEDEEFSAYDDFPTAKSAIRNIEDEWLSIINEQYASANQDAPGY